MIAQSGRLLLLSVLLFILASHSIFAVDESRMIKCLNNPTKDQPKSVINLTILISGSGIRLIGGGSTLTLIPNVTDFETGMMVYHIYPQPGEEKRPLDRREDLEGRLMGLRAQINQNPALKEDTVFILGDPDVSAFTYLAVMMLCHRSYIGFTNTVLVSELSEELLHRW